MLTTKTENDYQDAIVKKPKLMKIFKDEEKTKVLNDENLIRVMKFLREGPMTLNDFITAFKNEENEKSDKTIYRYLNKLKENDLVTQVGTRTSVCKDNKQIVERLFGRTARIFYFVNTKDICCSKNEKKEEEYIEQIEFLSILLKTKFKSITNNQVKSIISSISHLQEESLEDLAKNDEIFDEIKESIQEIDWKTTNYLLDLYKFISIIPKLIEFRGSLN